MRITDLSLLPGFCGTGTFGDFACPLELCLRSSSCMRNWSFFFQIARGVLRAKKRDAPDSPLVLRQISRLFSALVSLACPWYKDKLVLQAFLRACGIQTCRSRPSQAFRDFDGPIHHHRHSAGEFAWAHGGAAEVVFGPEADVVEGARRHGDGKEPCKQEWGVAVEAGHFRWSALWGRGR